MQGCSYLTFEGHSHSPCASGLFCLLNLTFVELDPEVIISSFHQPIRLRKMHNTELLTEAMSRPEVGSCAGWIRSRANGNMHFDSFALSMLSTYNFVDIFIFTYYYAMSVQRLYFPIFIFVGLGKVASGIDGVDSEIVRKKLHDFS